ncbi:MAG: alanyl-tRNA editing protein [Candidatus Bilamarchaeaceae archaeon]
MVEKLFRNNPYLFSCASRITSVSEKGVTLDRTVFFAFAGGQASDEGTIDGFRVLEALAEGPEIYYKLEGNPPLQAGQEVEVKINPERRMKIMRLHSAAHLVYEVFAKHTGIRKLIGSNVNEEKSRFDFEMGGPITPLLPKIEEEANALISQNLPIQTLPDDEKPDKWWWICREMKMPCGGTHVHSLGEIGKIKLKRKNLGSGKERIEIFLA